MSGFPDIVTSKIKADQSTSKQVEEQIGIRSNFTEDVSFPPKPKSQSTNQSPTPESAPVREPAQDKGEGIEIELGEEKEKVNEKKTIDLKNPDFFDREIDKKTAEAANDKKKEKSAEARSITEEKIDDPKLTPETDDYEFVAMILVEGLDLGTSTAFRWWAMDTSDAPYEMTKKKKDKLILILGEGLRRMNKKFPLVMLGIITLAIALYTPARKSNEMRKIKKLERVAIVKTTTPSKSAESKSKTKKKTSQAPKNGSGGVTRPPGGVSK